MKVTLNQYSHVLIFSVEGEQQITMSLTRMADAAGPGGMLIAFWDGRSPGTKHMIETARGRGLTVHIVSY